MKPIIGVLGSIKNLESGLLAGCKIINLNSSYINAVQKGGGIPIVIPITNDYENLKEVVSKMDGIILSGGVDVNPLLYNEEPQEKLGEVNDDLDRFNLEATKIALDLNKPILGICRGIQVLNVALGGTIYQDTSYIEECYIKHMQQAQPHTKTHSIDIDTESMIYSIFGEKCYVNSYHHQSIKELGKNLKIVALSKDNVVEAVEKVDSDFVVGVQWHPELMVDSCDKMLNLFITFINKCNK